MHLSLGPVPTDRQAAHRPRLPLPLVPTRNRYGPRAQRPLRGGSDRAHRGRAGDHRYAIGKRKRPERRALSCLQGRRLEQLPAGWTCRPLRAGRHVGSARSMPTRHPHLHVVEAEPGDAPDGRKGRAGILRPRRRLAGREFWSDSVSCGSAGPQSLNARRSGCRAGETRDFFPYRAKAPAPFATPCHPSRRWERMIANPFFRLRSP